MTLYNMYNRTCNIDSNFMLILGSMNYSSTDKMSSNTKGKTYLFLDRTVLPYPKF